MAIMYGPAIAEAIGKGDLDGMRSLVQEAEAYLNEHGDVAAALEMLRAEIAKVEQQGGGYS
jgi:hypothetical protein